MGHLPVIQNVPFQRQWIYHTQKSMYIVGFDGETQRFAILRINRQEASNRRDPVQLEASEYPARYDVNEMNALLRQIHVGNQAHGGLSFVAEAFGIIGCIRFTSSFYLLAITAKSFVGSICGHKVYKVDTVALIPLSPAATTAKDEQDSAAERRYRKLLMGVDLTKNFYFSYTYQLSSTLQTNFAKAAAASAQATTSAKAAAATAVAAATAAAAAVAASAAVAATQAAGVARGVATGTSSFGPDPSASASGSGATTAAARETAAAASGSATAAPGATAASTGASASSWGSATSAPGAATSTVAGSQASASASASGSATAAPGAAPSSTRGSQATATASGSGSATAAPGAATSSAAGSQADSRSSSRQAREDGGGSDESDDGVWDSMFVWNSYLTRALRSAVQSDNWVVPLIHGSWEQRQLSVLGQLMTMTLVARRSRHFAGTRYRKRGINDQGKTANEVETEQIIDAGVDWKTGLPLISSLVQMRGSIPLFWLQQPSTLSPKPDILLQHFDPLFEVTNKHFENLRCRYGNPIVVLNLLKSKERRPRETLLRREFAISINVLNGMTPKSKLITYIPWDFNKHIKHGGSYDHLSDNRSVHNTSTDLKHASENGGDNVLGQRPLDDSPKSSLGAAAVSPSPLLNTKGGAGKKAASSTTSPAPPAAPGRTNVLKEMSSIVNFSLKSIGLFTHNPARARATLLSDPPALNTPSPSPHPEIPPPASAPAAATSAAAGGAPPAAPSAPPGPPTDADRVGKALPGLLVFDHVSVGAYSTLQNGILRTNCIDCLDRTNVAQFAYGLAAFGRQLHELGVSDTPDIDADSSAAFVLMEMYEHMGNTIALQYGGSDAHSVFFQRQKGEWEATTQSRDLMTSIRRYYNNTYTDAEKQDAINLFLGNYVTGPKVPDLWDLETDHYLHGSTSGPHLQKLSKSPSSDSQSNNLSSWLAGDQAGGGGAAKPKPSSQQADLMPRAPNSLLQQLGRSGGIGAADSGVLSTPQLAITSAHPAPPTTALAGAGSSAGGGGSVHKGRHSAVASVLLQSGVSPQGALARGSSPGGRAKLPLASGALKRRRGRSAVMVLPTLSSDEEEGGRERGRAQRGAAPGSSGGISARVAIEGVGGAGSATTMGSTSMWDFSSMFSLLRSVPEAPLSVFLPRHNCGERFLLSFDVLLSKAPIKVSDVRLYEMNRQSTYLWTAVQQAFSFFWTPQQLAQAGTNKKRQAQQQTAKDQVGRKTTPQHPWRPDVVTMTPSPSTSSPHGGFQRYSADSSRVSNGPRSPQWSISSPQQQQQQGAVTLGQNLGRTPPSYRKQYQREFYTWSGGRANYGSVVADGLLAPLLLFFHPALAPPHSQPVNGTGLQIHGLPTASLLPHAQVYTGCTHHSLIPDVGGLCQVSQTHEWEIQDSLQAWPACHSVSIAALSPPNFPSSGPLTSWNGDLVVTPKKQTVKRQDSSNAAHWSMLNMFSAMTRGNNLTPPVPELNDFIEIKPNVKGCMPRVPLGPDRLFAGGPGTSAPKKATHEALTARLSMGSLAEFPSWGEKKQATTQAAAAPWSNLSHVATSSRTQAGVTSGGFVGNRLRYKGNPFSQQGQEAGEGTWLVSQMGAKAAAAAVFAAGPHGHPYAKHSYDERLLSYEDLDGQHGEQHPSGQGAGAGGAADDANPEGHGNRYPFNLNGAVGGLGPSMGELLYSDLEDMGLSWDLTPWWRAGADMSYQEIACLHWEVAAANCLDDYSDYVLCTAADLPTDHTQALTEMYAHTCDVMTLL